MNPSLVDRVAHRYLSALAEPDVILRQLSKNLDNFDQYLSSARWFQDMYGRRDDPGVLAELEAWSFGRGFSEGRSADYLRIYYMVLHQYIPFFRDMWDLSLSILQRYSLPDALRRKVEATSKFWASKQNPRKPRLPHGRNLEQAAAVVSYYVKFVEDTTTQISVLKEAMAKGRPITEGDAAEPMKVRAGSFTLINTGGFPEDVMQSVADAVGKAADLITRRGLGKVCYGDISVSRKVGRNNVAAFYMESSDDVFVRADVKATHKILWNIIHELGHRYEYRFLSRGVQAVLYRLIDIRHRDEIRKMEPKKGDILEDPKGSFEVTYVAGTTVHLRRKLSDDVLAEIDRTAREAVAREYPEADPAEIETRVTARREALIRSKTTDAHIDLEGYYSRKGVDPRAVSPDFKGFITPYASKSPSENFAEMFAAYCLGELPPTQTALFEEKVLG